MRILGIDYGTRRMGLAVSDELAVVARGIGRLQCSSERQTLEEIAKIVTEYQVAKVVIGYPVRTDGLKGAMCERVDRFAGLIGEALKLPVIKWDETLTTCEAEEILKNKGMTWQKRKKQVDELAAVLILQEYLNRGQAVQEDHGPSLGRD